VLRTTFAYYNKLLLLFFNYLCTIPSIINSRGKTINNTYYTRQPIFIDKKQLSGNF